MIYLDGRLNFPTHVDSMAKKLKIILDYLLEYVLKQLYYSMVYPQISYCISSWDKASSSILNTLIRLQKRVVRILSSSNYLAHTSPLFKNLQILKFEDVYKIKVLEHMYKTLVMEKYPILKTTILRSQPYHIYNTRNNKYIIPSIRIEKCRRTILYQGLNLWNALPMFLKCTKSLNSFKSSCRRYLLLNY